MTFLTRLAVLFLSICNATFYLPVIKLESPLKVDVNKVKLLCPEPKTTDELTKPQLHGLERLFYFKQHCDFQFIARLKMRKEMVFGIFKCKSSFDDKNIPGYFEVNSQSSSGTWIFFKEQQAIQMNFMNHIENVPLKVSYHRRFFVLCGSSEIPGYDFDLYKRLNTFLIRRKTETGGIVFQFSSVRSFSNDIKLLRYLCLRNVVEGSTLSEKQNTKVTSGTIIDLLLSKN